MPFWIDPIWTNRSNGNAELPQNDVSSANLLLYRQNRSQPKFLLNLQLKIVMPEVDRYDSVTPGYDSVTIYALYKKTCKMQAFNFDNHEIVTHSLATQCLSKYK